MRSRSTAATAGILGLSAIAGVYACASIAGIADFEIAACKGGVCDAATPETGGIPEGGTKDGGDGGGDADCPGTAGPPGVRVPGNFCIDRTEVTFGDYRAFQGAKGTDTSGQAPECQFNTSFSPTADGPDDKPVTGVDWCDAVAYCKWAGKRLCGRIDTRNGTTLTAGEQGDALLSQWLNVCTAAGRNTYSYGATFKLGACNTQESDAGATVPVASLPECVGGFPGVFDMIGNVWEWTDVVCAPTDAGGTEADSCFLRGGSYRMVPGQDAGVTCRVAARGPRGARIPDVGFRCCSL